MNLDQLIDQFSVELLEGNACFFVGAGISKPSKLPDWLELIKPFAANLGLAQLTSTNLPGIAQYIINENEGNRGPFISAIWKRMRRQYSPNKYHELISRTNVRTIWTTNYDTLLEDAFTNTVRDVKITDESVSKDVPDAQIEIIKMHGCIVNSTANEIVIAESDYEDYFLNRPAITQRLSQDLLNRSFLFIGYGFGDPNIQNIILQARRLAKNATRQHFMILMDRKDPEFKLWCNNLKRFGINVVTIKHFSELQRALLKISLRSRGRSVFVTGSHSVQNKKDAETLGKRLAEFQDVVLLDGQSTGIMRSVSNNFVESSITLKSDISKRLKIFPNPYSANPNFSDDISLLPLLKQWRKPLLRAAQIVVVFDGSMGTRSEVEVAKDAGCIIIPFTRSKKGLAYELISQTEIADLLNTISEDYVSKVVTSKASITDLVAIIKAAFQ